MSGMSLFLTKDPKEHCHCKSGLCCPLEGCCMLTPRASTKVEPPPKYTFSSILKTHSLRSNAQTGWFDLPAELRNEVYRLSLSFNTNIRMTLQPTITEHVTRSTRWGKDNRLALLAACREIYHEARPVYYGMNTFEIVRGTHRDVSLFRNPGMPYHLIRNISLLYPIGFGPTIWFFPHVWGHMVDDANKIVSRFNNLDLLKLVTVYFDNPIAAMGVWGEGISWDVALERVEGDNLRHHAQRTQRILLALAEVQGKKMPPCVRLSCPKTSPTATLKPGHTLSAFNAGLTLATRRRG
ncbi:hypothetical protein EJ04DRAFT_561130 [Polyplosphaeria fusca]|uniref:Uncharacterized protein n=1 Tax=Polyplosphaeria fusca TaxID=682080 RepID=A0A9P4R6Q4_9PLEO|nr:hypothetical protein EJ04DRAFT_561130 [Polyplosphaeria fusca]